MLLWWSRAVTSVVVGLILAYLFVVDRDLLKSLLSAVCLWMYSSFRSPFMLQLFARVMGSKPPSSLPKLDSIEKVSERVYRVLGQNPGMHTLQGTNIFLVAGKKTQDHVLIDTGEFRTSKQFLRFLFDEVFPKTGTKRLKSIILTHGHADHQGGVVPILEALRDRNMLPLPLIYKRNVKDGRYPAKGFDCLDIEDNQVFQVDSETTLQAVYTPGHTDDHVALVLNEDNALFSGDCVLGCGTAVFDDLHEYMCSLEKIKQLIQLSPGSVHTIYPGHGPVIRDNALAKIDEYITHRMQREQQIVEALSSLPPGKWSTSLELVRVVYGDALPTGLILSAQGSLMHHLRKLQKECSVDFRWPDLWRQIGPHRR